MRFEYPGGIYIRVCRRPIFWTDLSDVNDYIQMPDIHNKNAYVWLCLPLAYYELVSPKDLKKNKKKDKRGGKKK